MNMQELFEKHQSEYLKFENIHSKLTDHPADLMALRLLNQKIPPKCNHFDISAENNILACVSPDNYQLFLNFFIDDLEEKLSEEDVITLTRCGVQFDSSSESLYFSI